MTMENKEKKRLNTNSNVYTIIYAVIIVVVVAFLLAFVSRSLADKQNANVALDKKKQILYALNIRHLSDEQATEKYNEVVKNDAILNIEGQWTDAEGKVIDNPSEGNDKSGFLLNSSDFKADKLAVFICQVDGKQKFVVPVYGMGLWGPISGYLALNDDMRTIYGAYFNHEGETAGLGAEIKDNEQWQAQFKDKHIFAADNDGEIALAVMKKVDDTTTQVDVVTGATLTSDGVSQMLKEGLSKYMKFIKNNEGGK